MTIKDPHLNRLYMQRESSYGSGGKGKVFEGVNLLSVQWETLNEGGVEKMNRFGHLTEKTKTRTHVRGHVRMEVEYSQWLSFILSLFFPRKLQLNQGESAQLLARMQFPKLAEPDSARMLFAFEPDGPFYEFKGVLVENIRFTLHVRELMAVEWGFVAQKVEDTTSGSSPGVSWQDTAQIFRTGIGHHRHLVLFGFGNPTEDEAGPNIEDLSHNTEINFHFSRKLDPVKFTASGVPQRWNFGNLNTDGEMVEYAHDDVVPKLVRDWGEKPLFVWLKGEPYQVNPDKTARPKMLLYFGCTQFIRGLPNLNKDNDLAYRINFRMAHDPNHTSDFPFIELHAGEEVFEDGASTAFTVLDGELINTIPGGLFTEDVSRSTYNFLDGTLTQTIFPEQEVSADDSVAVSYLLFDGLYDVVEKVDPGPRTEGDRIGDHGLLSFGFGEGFYEFPGWLEQVVESSQATYDFQSGDYALEAPETTETETAKSTYGFGDGEHRPLWIEDSVSDASLSGYGFHNGAHSLTAEWDFTQENGATWSEINPEKVRIDFEDSTDCGGSNDLVQSGIARKTYFLNQERSLTFVADGNVEREFAFTDPGGFFTDHVKVYVDDVLIFQEGGEDDGLSCQMLLKNRQETVNLSAGYHDIRIESSTGDFLQHVGAFWEVELQFSPAL